MAVISVVFVLAIGGYFVLVSPIDQEIKKQQKALDAKRKDLKNLAGPAFKTIANQACIDAKQKYKEALAAEEANLLEAMKEFDIDLNNWPDGAPPLDDMAEFRVWMTNEYSRRNERLRASGTLFEVKDPEVFGDISEWGDVTDEDVLHRLRELIVSNVVVGAIVAAPLELTYTYKDPEGQVLTNKVLEKIVQLSQIEYLEKDKRGVHKVARSNSSATKAEAEIKTFDEHMFKVRLTGHFNIVARFVRLIEESKRGLFLTKSVSISRLESEGGYDTYDDGSDLIGRMQANNPEDEGVVSAEIVFALLDYPDK